MILLKQVVKGDLLNTLKSKRCYTGIGISGSGLFMVLNAFVYFVYQRYHGFNAPIFNISCMENIKDIYSNKQ